MKLLNELGPVEHIVLPTTALEHKIYIKDFSRKYPKVPAADRCIFFTRPFS